MKHNVAAFSIFFTLSLLSVFFSILTIGYADAKSATAPPPFNIKFCKDALEEPSRFKMRSDWLSCIGIEKKLYYQESSPEDIRIEAVSDLISLYHHLVHISGKASDQEKEDYWRKIQTESMVKRDNRGPVRTNSIINLRNSLNGNVLRVVLDVRTRTFYETHENKEFNSLQFNFLNTNISSGLERKSFPLKRKGIKADLSTHDQNSVLSISDVPYQSFKILQLSNPNRWVIDIRLADSTAHTVSISEQETSVPIPKKTIEDVHPKNQGIHKIIIDPGHGGKDPGATGVSGYSEKEAVLDIGLRLRELLIKQLKVDVIMTRSNDVFIPLEERTKMANEANADLFISIHANSSPHRSTHGVEIYLLGQSSDKRALRTAARENNVTEEEATHMDKNLLSIKNDLFQEYKKEESLELAHITRSSFMSRLRPSYPVVDLGVKTAPFYVLINTSMPSILAEVSFISNPIEEQRLRNKSYRQIMAESLLEGIKQFMAMNSNSSFF
ncbi:MAG: N-acetylmuramoyl-L-alanine amidase [Nitrospiria bacterium]